MTQHLTCDSVPTKLNVTSPGQTISIFDVGEVSHAQRCSSRTRRLRSRSHIRASETPARDGPFVARGRELREQKARSSDCYSRTAENDFCQGVMSAGRSRWRVTNSQIRAMSNVP